VPLVTRSVAAVRLLKWAGSLPDPHVSPKPEDDAGAAEAGSRLRGSRYRNMADLVGLFLLFAFLRTIIHIALHNVMPGVEVVLRYEQILHTLQTAVDDG
jgi:hypothetical protein